MQGQQTRNWLFPEQPRAFPWRRGVRSLLRGGHILSGGILLGAVLFHQPQDVIAQWGFWAVVTGLFLVLTDLHASCVVLFEWRGLAMLIKLLLVFLASRFPAYALPLLVTVLFIGATFSHISRTYRHRLWWQPIPMQPDTRHG